MEVHSQTAPYVSFRGVTLPNHGYVDLRLVGNSGNDCIQCHTDLETCCNDNGDGRGDWCFPNGMRLGFESGNGNIYQRYGAQRVELCHRDSHSPSGIYRCDITTNAVHDSNDGSVRETVYVGVYADGGKS